MNREGVGDGDEEEVPFRGHVIHPPSIRNFAFTSVLPNAWLPSRPHLFGQLMSLPSQSHSKKRKQTVVTEVAEEGLQPALKKPKHLLEKKLKKDKSKAGPSTSTGRGTSSSSKGEFQTITSTLNVTIPPIYAMEPRRGVQEMLDGMLMRYGFW